MSKPAISKHLKVLERAGLVARSREAQRRPCRLEGGPLAGDLDWVEGYRRFWELRLSRLDEYLRETQRKDKKHGPQEAAGVVTHELPMTDLRFALRSLARVKGLAITVILTLALGIGANAAIFSVVRGVLLRPLVNRDEDRLIYIRQSAPGIGVDNANFSVPEIRDLRAGVKTLTAFGDFSTIDFTMVGLGEPRVVRAGVVGGSYFDVMGLRAVEDGSSVRPTMGRRPRAPRS